MSKPATPDMQATLMQKAVEAYIAYLTEVWLAANAAGMAILPRFTQETGFDFEYRLRIKASKKDFVGVNTATNADQDEEDIRKSLYEDPELKELQQKANEAMKNLLKTQKFSSIIEDNAKIESEFESEFFKTIFAALRIVAKSKHAADPEAAGIAADMLKALVGEVARKKPSYAQAVTLPPMPRRPSGPTRKFENAEHRFTFTDDGKHMTFKFYGSRQTEGINAVRSLFTTLQQNDDEFKYLMLDAYSKGIKVSSNNTDTVTISLREKSLYPEDIFPAEHKPVLDQLINEIKESLVKSGFKPTDAASAPQVTEEAKYDLPPAAPTGSYEYLLCFSKAA